ncbi:hypothetical protein [Brevibacterium zhoupengii]|uniref:hypothetical protein n=1 Tax=Brevibacterium zhoupengii TaxID=2898795 RepID=UPI001E4CA86D|nr:hypothetical protein [Brevibacterium zhoupengii]
MKPINPDRSFRLAYGVGIKADPETLTKDECIDELYDLANFCSRILTEKIAIDRIVREAMAEGLNK